MLGSSEANLWLISSMIVEFLANIFSTNVTLAFILFFVHAFSFLVSLISLDYSVLSFAGLFQSFWNKMETYIHIDYLLCVPKVPDAGFCSSTYHVSLSLFVDVFDAPTAVYV